MEIQFQKTVVPYLQTLTQQLQTQEQTQQVRLSDAMPDIGKVLASWGQVLLRGKEWRSDSFSVSGGVKAWVLYEPEDGTQPRCVESWLPFQMKWDIPDSDRDGTVIACPMAPHVDARMLSDRKLMVRANVSIQACAMVPSDAVLHAPAELPPDVQTLSNTYPMLLPIEAGEKAFEMEESISLPSAEQPMETLLRYTLEPTLAESKLVADKLVLRGLARLEMLYMGTDSRLHNWGMELPFSQYTQLDEQYDSGGEVKICFGVTALEMEPGENGEMTLKAGITAQYTLYDPRQIAVVEDMYSPNREIKLTVDQLHLPSVLDVQSHTIRAEATPENMPARIADALFLADSPRLQVEDDWVQAALSGTFQLLGTDDEGNLRSENSRWEDSWSIPASPDADVRVNVNSVAPPQAAGSGVRTELQLCAMTAMQQPIRVVTGAELGEMTEPDPNRPSLILRRIGEESLWELAKRTGSTVEAIQKLNGLQQEPTADQMLLIPVM